MKYHFSLSRESYDAILKIMCVFWTFEEVHNDPSEILLMEAIWAYNYDNHHSI